MSTVSRAVFLSYASEDAPAAQRIAEALRAAGVEVWFDREELRGGDIWDQKIRQQIRDCRLFVPIISLHTEARLEGYFRREWKLASDRTDDMASEVSFLVPVVIDDTPNACAHVPERFRHVQWTRMPGGQTSAAFTEQVRRLLSPEPPPARNPVRVVDGSFSAPLPVPERRPFNPRRRAVWLAIAAVAVVALGYLAFQRLVRSKSAVQVGTVNSIAVLPLTNESGEASQQYFSDGLSEDLITALSQLPGLKVIGRTSSFQFRDSKEDSRSIGAKLGVAHLLEGSLRKSGEMIRVNAELIDTADGAMQWSERYDRPYKDLFALQDEISRAVAGALRVKLLPGEQATAQSERPPGGSVAAYNAMLQGRLHFARHTEAEYRKAIESYMQAIGLDPHYALAWSALSRVWSGLGADFLEDARVQEAYVKARDAADRALALSPDLAAAHVARGYLVENADFDWHAAEAEFRRALELAPNDGEAKFLLGMQLATFGELGQAIDLTQQALAVEPLQAHWYRWLAMYFTGVNHLDDAERAIRKAIELQPIAAGYYERLAIIECKRGHAQAALSAAMQEPTGYWQDFAIAIARQIGDEPSAADAALRTLIDKDSALAPYQIAEVYAVRNDATQTFAWLDRAVSYRDPAIQTLLYDPFILRYKNDPRFAAFCRRVGLPVPGQRAGG